MKGWALGICLASVVLAPTGALGDGGFIPATAFEKVRIPDQRALIHFADGKETLVIDTAFTGRGTNFAWIIPTPSVPAVEPATTGLFSTLQTIFQPEIVDHVFGLYWLEIFLGLVVAYVLRRKQRGESLIGTLVFVAFMMLMASMLMPALGTASVSIAGSQVRVIEQKRVGVYDTAVLSSSDGRAVFDWLKQNGFITPTNFIPAIRTYAQEGWCFVASRLHVDASAQEAARAHPLALTFKTQRPVYPLRLTGIDNEDCRIELHVFGPGRAEVPHFRVERCVAPSYPGASAPARWRLAGLEVRIRHPLLRRLVEGSPVATKLAGVLSPRQMREDAYIVWTPLQEMRLTRYSRQGAAVIAANVAVPVLLVGLLGLLCGYWACESEPVWAKRACRTSALILVAGLACWGMIFVCLPKTSVVLSWRPWVTMRQIHNYVVPAELTKRWAEKAAREEGKAEPDVFWVRQQLAANSVLRQELGTFWQTNHVTGEPWREEDSPGNYTLRETSAGIDYLWYDVEGGENVVPLFPKPDGKQGL
jgi:hypothetical protein